MTDSAVIVGGGVIGLATAYRLARDGLAVTVVDAAHGETGASVHNAGWIVPIMSAPVPAPGLLGTGLKWMARKDSPLRVRLSPRPEHVRFMLGMLRHCNPKDFQHGLEALTTLNERTVELFDEYEKDGVRFELHRTGQLMVFHTRKTMQGYQAAAAEVERIGHTAVPSPAMNSGISNPRWASMCWRGCSALRNGTWIRQAWSTAWRRAAGNWACGSSTTAE